MREGGGGDATVAAAEGGEGRSPAQGLWRGSRPRALGPNERGEMLVVADWEKGEEMIEAQNNGGGTRRSRWEWLLEERSDQPPQQQAQKPHDYQRSPTQHITPVRLIHPEIDPYHYTLHKTGLQLLSLWRKGGYHVFLEVPWWFFYTLVVGLYLCLHVFFATLYFLDVRNIEGIDSSLRWNMKYWLCFCFSVQSLHDIGYGLMSPTGLYVNLVVALEAFLNLTILAAVTGVVFARAKRASQQKHRILFSKVAVVNNAEHVYLGSVDEVEKGGYQEGGCLCLALRLINVTKTQLCEPSLRLYLVRKEKPQRIWNQELRPSREASEVGNNETIQVESPTGTNEEEETDKSAIENEERAEHENKQTDKRFMEYADDREGKQDPLSPIIRVHELSYELNIQDARVRSVSLSTPLLPFPWLVVHPIDKFSPLYGYSQQDFEEAAMEVVVVIGGVDEGSAQNMQARWSYCPYDIRWDHRFVSIIRENRRTRGFDIRLDLINHTVPT
ncbi:ATP-sensitive inward rectifier potassium channel 10 [Balamuthia mandrillaris]